MAYVANTALLSYVGVRGIAESLYYSWSKEFLEAGTFLNISWPQHQKFFFKCNLCTVMAPRIHTPEPSQQEQRSQYKSLQLPCHQYRGHP